MTTEDCSKIRNGFPRSFPDTPSNVLQQLSLKGKVTVVTGAADGIGFAVSEAFAEAGANVAMLFNSSVSLVVQIRLWLTLIG